MSSPMMTETYTRSLLNMYPVTKGISHDGCTIPTSDGELTEPVSNWWRGPKENSIGNLFSWIIGD